MPDRFFVQFFNASPMEEIAEETARARRSFAKRVDGPPVRYERVIGGELDSVIYPAVGTPGTAYDHYRANYPGLAGEFHGPLEMGDGSRWRVWYFDPNGVLRQILEYVLDGDGRYLGTDQLGTDGRLQSFARVTYDERGGIAETIYYDADGKETGRDDD